MEADDVAVLQLLEQADLAEGGGGDALGRSCFNRCSLHNAKNRPHLVIVVQSYSFEGDDFLRLLVLGLEHGAVRA